MSTPDWLEELDPYITNPYAKLILRIKNENFTSMEEIYEDLTNREKQILSSLDPPFTINKIMVKAIKAKNSLEQLTKHLTWSEFENAIAKILSYAGWNSQINYRYFGEGVPSVRDRYEIDVLGVKKPYVLAIDCKRYSSTSQAPMREAAENQKERVFVLFEQLPLIHDSLHSNFPKWKTPVKILPLILTWRDHQLRTHGQVAICCVNQLEDFIINLDAYIVENDLFYLIWDTYA